MTIRTLLLATALALAATGATAQTVNPITISTQTHAMTCHGELSNSGTDAEGDTYFDNIVWVGTSSQSPPCFFKWNTKDVSLAILSACELNKPCVVKATVRDVKEGGECPTKCTNYEILKVHSARRQ